MMKSQNFKLYKHLDFFQNKK